MRSIFHFAFNVTDLAIAREFYGNILQCQEGRSTETWVDFDFYGHQISLHFGTPFKTDNTGKVGEHLVPMPHFGLILSNNDWDQLAQRLKESDVTFEILPSIRFKGEPGEQRIMFFRDPCGNPIEIKSFDSHNKVFDQ